MKEVKREEKKKLNFPIQWACQFWSNSLWCIHTQWSIYTLNSLNSFSMFFPFAHAPLQHNQKWKRENILSIRWLNNIHWCVRLIVTSIRTVWLFQLNYHKQKLKTSCSYMKHFGRWKYMFQGPYCMSVHIADVKIFWFDGEKNEKKEKKSQRWRKVNKKGTHESKRTRVTNCRTNFLYSSLSHSPSDQLIWYLFRTTFTNAYKA